MFSKTCIRSTHPTHNNLVTLDDGETLLDQFPSRVLFFKGDKAEVEETPNVRSAEKTRLLLSMNAIMKVLSLLITDKLAIIATDFIIEEQRGSPPTDKCYKTLC